MLQSVCNSIIPCGPRSIKRDRENIICS